MPDPQELESQTLNVAQTVLMAESLRTNFQRQSGNFNIDLDPYTAKPADIALGEIRADPSIASHVTGPHIYTDDINDTLFKDGLDAQINALAGDRNKSVRAVYLENRETLRPALIQASEQFMRNLNEAAPELHDLIQRNFDQNMPEIEASYARTGSNLSTQEVRAIETINTADNFLNNYFVDTFYILDKPVQPAGDNADRALPGQEPALPSGTKTVIAFLPGSNFSFADSSNARHPALMEAKTPPPGTNEEWAAIVTAHETEHYIDALKDRDPKIMPPEMKAALEMMPPETKNLLAGMENILANMRETESDMSSANALSGQVNPDMLPYLAALRMGDSMLQTLPRLVDARASSSENSIVTVLDKVASHDTGYVLNEYLATGIIPDHLGMHTTIGSFYEKTAQQYAQRAAGPLQEAGRSQTALKDMGPLTLSDTVDLVQRTLAQDPPVYSPQEEQIAQTFVDSMTGQLGIERGNIDRTIKNSIESLPPQTQPDAPAAESDVVIKIGAAVP